MSRQTKAQALVAQLEANKADAIARYERETETRHRVHVAELDTIDRAIEQVCEQESKRKASRVPRAGDDVAPAVTA